MSMIADIHEKNPGFGGRKLSAEHKAKISESLTGRKHSAESRAKMSVVQKKRHEDPTKHPMFGKKHSAETKARISAANTGSNHPMFGKKLSLETRQKISESMRGNTYSLGHKHSEETKQKMSEDRRGKNHYNYGKPLSSEHKANVSKTLKKLYESPTKNPMFGKKHSPEARAKMSETSKKRWQDPEFREKMSGRKAVNWQGGISFEPYCPLFNHYKKEEIRNRDGRRCHLCGKSEILNGRRLAVHHIDGSKTQGCRGEKWYLCALCVSCNSRHDTVEKEFLIVSNLNKDVLTIQGVKA
ncbi:MAG: hypothetical protein KGD60_15095 [Candidatus Thorarchaeota archaeon]|nr:hypothetical protein [Candidatus Thorarchaeota archaeon]